ncbi:phospholipase D-like domain-containing protein [Thermus thermamylovorans]|uniref:ATP-polyphosphate phosphotransferase n=1 Tax=Thermus thermamylovorans TaxID=2509362 RepID=A0A4Q9B092_9DEIN|nr:phospholipase D-like domain-containing protein [Thermus thermamylovorans]TBH16542.1 polyphosphate kinase [Thermus thermamylovorans]
MHPTPEASWLQFNRRVLLQTERRDFPLLERMRFLAIWNRNLDEFFAARIAKPFLQGRGTPGHLDLLREAREQASLAHARYLALLQEAAPRLRVLGPGELDEEDWLYFRVYLGEVVAPKTDLIPWEAAADLSHGALYFASRGYLVRLPQDLPRLLPVPGREGAYVRLGALMRARSDLFLPQKEGLYEFRVLRLLESERARADWDELAQALEGRQEGLATLLVAEEGFPEASLALLRGALGLLPEEVFLLPPPLNLTLVERLVAEGPAEWRFPPLRPEKPRRFLKAPWEVLGKRDLLLYHPFQDYAAVERFAKEALRPEVEEVWATLYRIGEENPLAEALLEAAQAGKRVHVLLEGRARFDELLNLYWYLRFLRAGVEVLPLPERKVHAKALLLLTQEGGAVHLGTGNYNPQSGRLYTDFSLFTARPEVVREVRAFFLAMREERPPRLSLLQTGEAIRDLLVREILAEAHPKGRILLKCNHLTDPVILEALVQAAEAGGRVDLLVRSTLTRLHPAFRARSLVGRFLEHARVAAFRAGGAWRVYLTSADAMPRNFHNRFELLFPVLDKEARREVVRLLKRQMRDDRNAFLLTPEGERRLWGGRHDAQRP